MAVTPILKVQAVGQRQLQNVQTVAAAGSVIGDATQIGTKSQGVIYATGADGTKGIKLPAASPGKVYIIKNRDSDAATLKVWPYEAATSINGATIGTAFSVPTGAAFAFACVSSSLWVVSSATVSSTTPTSVASTGAITSSSATAGIGYATGAGGTVTQGTSRTTGVTINKVTGNIVLFSEAGSQTYQTFTVTNSAVAAGDVVVLSQKSGTDPYQLNVTAVAAGSFKITAAAVSGSTTEAPVINFAVIKGVAA